METGLAPRLWRYRAEWIPAYAGMTVRRGMTVMGGALRLPTAVPSPRRVRGVLSPCRERGIRALGRLNGGGIPA